MDSKIWTRVIPDEVPSDHALLRRFRCGQDDGPTLLYLRYAERLHALVSAQSAPSVATRVDSEDIVQSVFRTFFRRVAEGQYDVPDGEEIWKLLLVIALNKVRAVSRYHRAARRDVRLTSGGEAVDRAADERAGGDEMAMTVLRMVIDEVLDALPPGHRPIVGLRIEGYEVAEIAGRVQRSRRTVERILQEFRQRLDARIHEGE